MSKSIETCYAHYLRRADRVMTQFYNDHFAAVGLKGTQFPILRATHYMGTTTAAQLQKHLVMDQTTLSRALQPLIRDGYIQVADGTTKREKALSLTDKGEALFQEALVHWHQAQKKIEEHLGPELCEQLEQLSKAIVSLKSS